MMRLKMMMMSMFMMIFAIVSAWEYENDGHLRWPSLCLTGHRQSPINFDVANLHIDYDMEELTLFNYNILVDDLKVKNKGSGVVGEINTNYSYTITGAGLSTSYHLHSFHFHWSQRDDEGSEHTLAGLQYPLELHLIHIKDGILSIEEALEHGDGLAVLGVKFRRGSHGEFLDHFVSDLEKLKDYGSETHYHNFDLRALLPWDRTNFYRYEGSLTTPGCQEAVQWIVFSTPLTATHEQLESFRHLRNKTGGVMTRNNRPTQLVHDRRISFRKPQSLGQPGCPKTSGVDKNWANLGFLLVFLTLTNF